MCVVGIVDGFITQRTWNRIYSTGRTVSAQKARSGTMCAKRAVVGGGAIYWGGCISRTIASRRAYDRGDRSSRTIGSRLACGVE